MNDRVSVVGAGVGVFTCATVLDRRGWSIALPHVGDRLWPVLVLNEVTLALLDDLWGPDVVADGHPITRRHVRWGSDEALVPVTSVAMDGRGLVERLRPDRSETGSGPPRWVIDGARGSRPRVTFGRRCVIQADAALVGGDPSTASVETVDEGWVHLAPVSAERAVLQGMVPTAPADPAAALARMVSATVDIRHRVGAPTGSVTVFPAAPSLSSPSCAPGWIGVADAVVSLDPVSGFGTAWSLRGGVLAAAVVDAVASGLPEPDCLRHYDDRLRMAVYEHVEHCVRLYSAAFTTPAWRRELDDMTATLDQQRQSRPRPTFALRLDGMRLTPFLSR